MELDWIGMRKPYLWVALLAILMTLSFGESAYGQLSITISPTNPAANQPITFYVSEPTPATNYVFVTLAAGTSKCSHFTSSSWVPPSLVYKSGVIISDPEGHFSVTLSKGLPTGSYCIVVAAQPIYSTSVYSILDFFTVGSSAPVPEAPSALAFLLSALLVAIYVLRRKKTVR